MISLDSESWIISFRQPFLSIKSFLSQFTQFSLVCQIPYSSERQKYHVRYLSGENITHFRCSVYIIPLNYKRSLIFPIKRFRIRDIFEPYSFPACTSRESQAFNYAWIRNFDPKDINIFRFRSAANTKNPRWSRIRNEFDYVVQSGYCADRRTGVRWTGKFNCGGPIDSSQRPFWLERYWSNAKPVHRFSAALELPFHHWHLHPSCHR